MCLGSHELVIRPGNLGPLSGAPPSTIPRHILDQPSHRPLQPQKNEGWREPNNRIWLTMTTNLGKVVNPEAAEVKLEQTQGLGVFIHLQDHPTPRSSLGTSHQVSTHTYPLKCSEHLGVWCRGRLLQETPRENGERGGPDLGHAVPDARTWVRDSCADRRVAVISVQVGCPCVIISRKQVCFLKTD